MLKPMIEKLAACIFVLVPIGVGKNFVACALAQKAYRDGYSATLAPGNCSVIWPWHEQTAACAVCWPGSVALPGRLPPVGSDLP